MGNAVRRVELAGRARPAVVWERYADLAAWTTWSPQIRSVAADGPRLALGRTGVVRAVGGFGVPFVVTAVDAQALTWSWIARLGPLTLTLHHDVSPTCGGPGPAWSWKA